MTTGSLTGFYGGVVEAVDGTLGRLRVRVPLVYGPGREQNPNDQQSQDIGSVPTEQLPWALPFGLPSGGQSSSGAIGWLPQVGDRVVVVFLDGEPEKPLWTWFAQSVPQHNEYPYQQLQGQEYPFRESLGETAPAPMAEGSLQVRLTFYSTDESSVDVDTAANRSSTGVTLVPLIHCAVNPAEIPYGTQIQIPGIGVVTAVDTGSAVVERIASRGQYPIIDVFVGSASNQDLYASRFGETPVTVNIVGQDPDPRFAAKQRSAVGSTPSPLTLGPSAPIPPQLDAQAEAAIPTSENAATITRYGHTIELNPQGVLVTTRNGYGISTLDSDQRSGNLVVSTPGGQSAAFDDSASLTAMGGGNGALNFTQELNQSATNAAESYAQSQVVGTPNYRIVDNENEGSSPAKMGSTAPPLSDLSQAPTSFGVETKGLSQVVTPAFKAENQEAYIGVTAPAQAAPPNPEFLGAGWMPGILHDLVVPKGRRGIIQPTAVVIHRTAGFYRGDYSVGKYTRSKYLVSFHFLIGTGPNEPTVQFGPVTMRLNHGGTANRFSVGIELTSQGAYPTAPVSSWAMQELIKIIRWLNMAAGIPITPPPGGLGSQRRLGKGETWAGLMGHNNVYGTAKTDRLSDEQYVTLLSALGGTL